MVWRPWGGSAGGGEGLIRGRLKVKSLGVKAACAGTYWSLIWRRWGNNQKLESVRGQGCDASAPGTVDMRMKRGARWRGGGSCPHLQRWLIRAQIISSLSVTRLTCALPLTCLMKKSGFARCFYSRVQTLLLFCLDNLLICFYSSRVFLEP